MWIPAGLVYVAAGLALFAGWLRESGMRARSLVLDGASSTKPADASSERYNPSVEQVS